MNYNSLMNKPTINYRELIGDNTVSEVGGITEEEFNTLMSTDLASYYTKAQIDDLFSRSYVFREKSGSIVTFDCPGSVNGIDKVVSEIVAVQSGSGDPSPTNVRPISGWSAVNLVVSPTTDAADGTTYTTTLKDGQGNPLVCYGGTLDVVSGELVVDSAYYNISDITFSESGNYYRILDNSIPFAKSQFSEDGILSHFNYGAYGECIVGTTPSSGHYIMFYKNKVDDKLSISSVADFNAYLVSQKTNGNPVQLVYKLATPQTIQLTPTAVKSLLGTNNIWADTGDVIVTALDKII